MAGTIVTSAYTLTEARHMLAVWKECEEAIASGTAKAYRVGTREYTALDLDLIAERIRFFANLCDALEGGQRSSRVVRIVPRDL